MRKILILLASLAAVLFVSASCDRSGERFENETVPSAFKLRLSVDGLSTQCTTRSTIDPLEDENSLSSLYLMFFDKTGDMSGTFVDYIEVKGALSPNTTLPLDIPADNGVVTNRAYTILAIGNIGDDKYITNTVEGWMNDWIGQTERYVREKAFAEVRGSATNNQNAIDPAGIIMYGSTSKASDTGTIELTLLRDVSRFDVKRDATVAGKYNLISVDVWNAYPKTSIFGEGLLDYSNDAARIRRYYGYENPDKTKDIAGHLYAFENKVISPVLGDQLTTCLIIGLEDVDKAGQTMYFRANINPVGEAQNLKRNNAYVVTINTVSGEGYPSKEEAYAGLQNDLGYTINNWDLDSNGLIISDSNSLLAVPTKTAIFGADGGNNVYSITTFSSLPSPSPLKIKSQVYEPAGKIEATLDRNTLTINAKPMDIGEADRHGMVTLSFAGLEATINVIQSASADVYLKVTLPDDWTGILPAMAPYRSDRILVSASGDWTVQLIDPEGNFSLAEATRKDELKTSQNPSEIVNDGFSIFIRNSNTDVMQKRAFLIISLDEDPLNYASVVMLTQKGKGTIEVNPSGTVVFNGSQAVTSGNNEITVTSTDWIGRAAPWTFVVEPDGENDDTARFNVVSSSGGNTGDSGDKIIINTSGKNQNGVPYKIKIRVSTGSTELYINVIQTSLNLVLLPDSFTNISKKGGQTDLVSLSGLNAATQWTATVEVKSNTPGKTVTNHIAYLVNEDGNIIDGSQPQSFDTKFRVVMPKIYFPNRERVIIAVVKVSIVGSAFVKELSVYQESLVPKDVNVWATASGYGTILGGSAYFRSFINSFSYNSASDTTTYLDTFHSFINLTMYDTQTINRDSYNWSDINEWLDEDCGVILVTGDTATMQSRSILNGNASPYKKARFQIVNSSTGSNAGIGILNTNASIANKRVYKYIMSYGNHTVNLTTNYFVADGARNEAEVYPDSATPIILVNNSYKNGLLVIDPKTRLVFLGDGQIFGEAASVSGGRDAFMKNFIEYLQNAAKYSSHFTDMLIDYVNENEEGYVEAPWDDVWGVNKMTDKN